MQKSITLLLFSLICLGKFNAQISDDFNDGDFTFNPIWSGTTADFSVNANQELQLTSLVAGASYLTTLHNLTSLDNNKWSRS